jgi:hypothetical protein
MSAKMTDKERQSRRSSREEQESVLSDYDRVDRPVALDEEKSIGLDGEGYATKEESEFDTSGRGRSQGRRSQDSKSLRTTRSHQSRAGGDGYTCFDAEPDNIRPNNSKRGVVTEQPYLVTWDGDSDPANPRSMSKWRRWVIVLICSASSLCV